MRKLVLIFIFIFTCLTTANATTYWYDDKDNPYFSFYQQFVIPHIEFEEPDFFNMFHTNIELDKDCPCKCFH